MRTHTFNPNPEITSTMIEDERGYALHIIDEHHTRPYFMSTFDNYEFHETRDGRMLAIAQRFGNRGFHIAVFDYPEHELLND